ncbi:MAG: UDP-N-acetylmuramoyl-tripeptide--D-alanyl-D-alanine ligase [Coriobacteriales bacterium]|nr:UDP-N-acetylmuramoyl-tripeptide--D-alanyl-D-alanine ligase [Coriobacteriales bacterium]
MSIAQIAAFSQARVVVAAPDPERRITRFGWDSRAVQPGSLFVAFPGERVDGNDFIASALSAGAAVVLASRPLAATQDGATLCRAAQDAGAAILEVARADAVAAFQRLAGGYRGLLTARTVGITGSSGKTTTKDMVAAVLSSTYNTTATQGNYNNEIGLPATILAAGEATEMLICEMGMQALGEIAELAAIAAPQIGVITNIGVTHCKSVGSRENIARAKAELIEALPEHNGIAILNGDDAFTPFIREQAQTASRDIRVVLYGLGAHNDIRAAHIDYDEQGRPSFDLWLPDGRPRQASLALQGEHNVLNALAAAAVGIVAGVTPEAILRALALCRPAAMRQEVHETASGVTVIDDTYNANPDSMRAALALLNRLPHERMHIAVLGDMYELGSEEQAFHREVGAYAHINRLDLLITVGDLGAQIAAGAREIGRADAAVVTCSTPAEALEALLPYLSRRPIILVKASRGMRLEQVVEEVLARC